MDDWGSIGQDWSFEQFQIWQLSDYNPNALPFPGGWPAQPDWVKHDFKTFLKVKRWTDLNGKLVDPQGLPRMDDN